MSRQRFSSHLEASSNHASGGGSAYAPLRESVVKQIIEQDYDEATGVSWPGDQDPFGHIVKAGFSHFASTCNLLVFESFEAQLGDKVDDVVHATRIGVIVKQFTVNIKRPVSYPDSIICAVRLGEVKPDRYFITTTMWSLRQQPPAAESSVWVGVFNYHQGQITNLAEIDGVHKG